MSRRIVIVLIISCLASFSGVCQKMDSGKDTFNIPTRLPAIIVHGDTMPIVNMSEIMVIGERVFANYQDAMKYYTLKRDVKIVYPYAIMAEATFEQCEETVKNMTSESEKKQYVKTVEKQMMKQYSDELKSLTTTQGRLLIKLIDRQTGVTSYQMVKDLRGSLSAFMWQTVACLFGNSLKATYDVDGEDRQIESIIHLIEVGAI